MILVTGATGNVGKELVGQLVEVNPKVRVLVRDPKKAAHLGARVDVAVGDLNDPNTLRPAMDDVEAVYIIAFYTPQVRNVVDAAKQAGVKRLVRQSAIEAGAVPPLGPGKWHREQEEVLEHSGLAWTHLRPTLMMVNTLQWWAWSIQTQRAVFFPGGEGKVSPVDPRDIAAVARAVLTSAGAHDGRAYDVTGPELLTIGEMVGVLSRVLGGDPIRYVDVPESAAVDGWKKAGMSPELGSAMVETLGALRSSRFAHVAETVERLTGRKPRTFDAWCREHAGAFSHGK